MNQANYFDYEFVWSHIKEMMDEFNTKFNYGFHIEPFLMSGCETVGMFSDYGLFVFFRLNSDHVGKYSVLSRDYELVRIEINPEILISYIDFEVLLVTEQTRLFKLKRGNIKNYGF